jgi:hypothetical protein
MNSYDDWKQVVRRNKLLGMWAAKKMGKTGQDAEEYSNALAVGTLDPVRSDDSAKFARTSALRAWWNRMSRSYRSWTISCSKPGT